MIRTYIFQILFCLFAFNLFGQTTIAGWDFTGSNTALATVAATTFNSNLISASGANNITRGPGAVASAANNSFRTTGFQNNGISVSNTDYFQVTLSATAGNKVSLASIDGRLAGTASFAVSPGVSNQFAYSLDGTNFTLIGSPQITIGTPATLPQIVLTGITALQNVNAGTTITLRFYASGQTTTGGWGFNSPSSGILGLDIKGTVQSAAQPPSINSSLTSTATFNSAYSYTVTATNTPTSFNATGLPTGLNIDTNTGVISGTPTSGTASNTPYQVTLSATNGNGTGNATLNLTVNKANQTITFGPLANVLDNAPNYQIASSASSGLPLTFTSSVPSIAAIVAPDSIDPISAGMTLITASQAGNADYNAATNVDQNLTVVSSSAMPQTITFTLTSPVTYGDPDITLTGTSTSMLPVSYVSSNPSVVSVTGNLLTIVSVGTAIITASQSGNAAFAPAPNVDQTIIVNPKPLTVINAVAANKVYNGLTAATVTGAALSGIVGSDIVTLSAANANFDTPDVGVMKPVTTNYTLTGNNANRYTLPVQPTGLNADITQASQTISFPIIPTQGLASGTYTLNATASSGLGVTYVSSNPSVATVSGNVLTLLSVGSSTITASQAGNSNYTAAADVSRVLTVDILPVMYNFGTSIPGTLAPTSGIPVNNLTYGSIARISPINGTTTALTTTSTSSAYIGSSGAVNFGNVAKTGVLKADSSAYFEVMLNPAAGYRVRLDSLFFGSRSTTTGPQTLAIYTNKDFYQTPIATATVINNSTWTLVKPTFDTISNGNNPLILRIYAYNGVGNVGLGSAVNWRIDDVSIKAIAKPLSCTPPTNVVITGNQQLCAGDNSLLTATGASTYLWEVPGNITLDTLRVSPTTSKSYIVRGYSASGGCYQNDTIVVTVNPRPGAPTGASAQSFCSSASPTVASLSATGTGIKWYDMASGGMELIASTPLVNGVHYFASQSTSGCESTARLDVTATIEGTVVTTGANTGPGSLRSVVACASEGGTVTIDAAVATITMSAPLLLDKNLMIMDATGGPVAITFDFTSITTYGIGILTGKNVTFDNLGLTAINNSGSLPLIQVDGTLNAINVTSNQ